jgi:hypothetical protein
MSTNPTFPSSQVSANVRAAIGAAVAVFVAAVGVLAVAIPAWAAHVAEYEQADHVNDMFGDPAGWLLIFAVLVLTPLAVGVASTVGASVALKRRYGGATRGGIALFFINAALSAPAMLFAASVAPKGVPTAVLILASALIMAAGAALGAVTGVMKPREGATDVLGDAQ